MYHLTKPRYIFFALLGLVCITTLFYIFSRLEQYHVCAAHIRCVCVCIVRAIGMVTVTIWAVVTREEEAAATVEEGEDPCQDKIAPTENTG